jgi:hypothetical protein
MSEGCVCSVCLGLAVDGAASDTVAGFVVVGLASARFFTDFSVPGLLSAPFFPGFSPVDFLSDPVLPAFSTRISTAGGTLLPDWPVPGFTGSSPETRL